MPMVILQHYDDDVYLIIVIAVMVVIGIVSIAILQAMCVSPSLKAWPELR